MSDTDNSQTGGAIEPTAVQTGSEVATQSGGSGIVPASQPTFGGLISTIINYLSLAARFIALAAAAVLLKEALHLLKARMHRDAAFARKVAELCGQAGVDAYFVALFLETAQSFERVAAASGALADAADQMQMNAQFVKDAHQAEYGGIYEAVNASPYEQPKAQFNEVH